MKETRVHDDPAIIDPLFEEAFLKLSPSSKRRGFVDSIYKWWLEKGYITQGQYQAVKKAAKEN